MIKRVFDVVASATALVLFLPVIVVVAWQVRRRMGSPVLFRQFRPGLYGVPFEMFKFRTMKNAFGVDGDLLPDAERLNPFGRFLRSSSLDELPELWNVLKGDMSLVGPRPLLIKYMPYYTDEEQLRFLVRPGITGWAQINGRNTTPWCERLALDVWYVKNMSFLLDMKIILKTISRVVSKNGVVGDPSSFMRDLDDERNS